VISYFGEMLIATISSKSDTSFEVQEFLSLLFSYFIA
jgi:hypothetical protein